MTYGRLLLYAEPNFQDIGLLIVGVVTAIASGIPFPLLGILFGQLMDDINSASCDDSTNAISSDYQSQVNGKVVTVVYIGIGNLALIYVYIVSWNLFGERLAQRLREKYFRSLLHKDVPFFDQLSPGEVSSHLNADITTIQSGTSEKVGIVLNAVAFFVAAYTIAFIKDARLGGMLVSLTPAFLIMSLVGGHYIGKYSGAMSAKISSASSIALESLSNIMIVHAFSANSRLEARFTEILGDAKTAGIRKAIAASVQSGLLYFIAYSASALAYWQGSRSIAAAVAGTGPRTTVGTIYTVIFILVDATIILSTVAPFLQIFGAAQSAFEKLQQNMDHESGLANRQVGSHILEKFSPSFEMHDVSFAYPSRPEMQVLTNVNIRFPAKRTTAIVGLSGSGKSTIASLLLRLYDATSGSLTIGDYDIKAVQLQSLRGCISLVQQEASLFDRSIMENIALGLVNSRQHRHLSNVLQSGQLGMVAEMVAEGQEMLSAAQIISTEAAKVAELVVKAATMADADAFIRRLRNGYGTIVGSRGALISGGQKQRIALARALVKDPEILILDEATASLDSASEQRIQQALSRASQGRTTVVIAHRLSTIRDADNIIVMRSGRVVEQGTHVELVNRAGTYFELLNLQTSEKEVRNRYEHALSTSSMSLHTVRVEEEKSTLDPGPRANENQVLDPKGSTSDKSDPDIDQPASVSLVSRTLSSLFRPHLLLTIVAFVAVIVVGGTYSAAATIFGNTIGALSPCRLPSTISSAGAFFALMFFVLAIVEFFANIISWSGFGTVAEKVLHQVRVLSFRSLLEQDLSWHESANRTPSALLALITSDGNALAGLTGSTIGTVFSISVNLIAAIVLTHILAWKLALVCLATVPLILGAGSMRLVVLARFAARHKDAFTTSVGIAVEAIGSIRTVAALSLQDEVLNTYRRSLKAPIRETTKQSLYANMWLALAYGLPTFIYALSFWWGTKLIIAGDFSQVQFYIVNIALLVSAQLWGQLFTIAPDITKAITAVKRVVNLLNLGSDAKGRDIDDSEATATTEKYLPSFGGSNISFSQVDFSYPARPDIQVLKSLSLEVRSGQFVAFVGPSGAGKSTIVALLERMYRPTAGIIKIDGLDIASASSTYRDAIAFVPQDSVLFDGTIRFNVALGAPSSGSVTNVDIEEACRVARIHETIMTLPDGYETNCGAGGAQLSGGQKQRLAIARALVRKPRLLLLDESTSALDAESERSLSDGLETARTKNRMTIIAIAHRLSTIRNADSIFMIEDGRVIAEGTHEELMKKSSSYRTNAEHQGF